MHEVLGDLVDLAKQGGFDVICHGANCFHVMGAGVALAIARAFPEAVHADQDTPYGDRGKLGTLSLAPVRLPFGKRVIVANLYTQFSYGNGDDLDMEALAEALDTVNREFAGKRVGLPRIGCGLAGGDWKEVRSMMEDCLRDCDVTIVKFHRDFPKEG